MKDLYKVFTAEAAAQAVLALAAEPVKSLIASAKAGEGGTFEVIISTADIDRQGEIVDQSGWDLERYKENPVVLWGHDYWALPIGITDGIEVVGGRLVARGRFAPEDANPFAQQVRRLYDLGIVRATSVGFIAHEMDGDIVKKAELLEFSFVPVPANPYALSLSKVRELGLDLGMIAMKGLALKTKEEGDECEMPDGSMGEMHPNDSGEMVCMPKAAKSPEGAIEEEKNVQQIGAVLAEMLNAVDDAIVRASRLIISIIESEYGQSAAGKEVIISALKAIDAKAVIGKMENEIADALKKLGAGVAEEPPGGTPSERSEDGEGVNMSPLNDWLMAKHLLRSVVTAANGALERMNDKERARRTGRRR